MILFITGATAGFGAAIARSFAQDGAKIIATGRRADRLAALAEELGPNILPLALDVRDRAAGSSGPSPSCRTVSATSTCWSTMPAWRWGSVRPTRRRSPIGRPWSIPISRAC